jgi:hypothetical protein
MTDPQRRAAEAERLWQDEMMVEAREHIRAHIIDLWANSPMDDLDGREKLRYLLHVHKLYDDFFKRAIADGKLAKLEAERKRLGLREILRAI